jgi:hypothetical protein
MCESVILPVCAPLNKDVAEKRFQRRGDLSRVAFIVPPTGFEPVLLPPEGSALSPELRGLIRQLPNLQQNLLSLWR